MTVETVDLAISPEEHTMPQMTGVESALRKLVLSASTMLGMGYFMVNVPLVILLIYFWTAIPISSQANIAAITGRMMFLFASIILAVLGLVVVFGGVKFFEGGQTKTLEFLGVLLAATYILCLGIGSTIMLPEGNLEGLLLLVAPVLAVFGTATYMVPQRRFKLAGSIAGIVGGVLLAYAVLRLNLWELVFDWDVSFGGPFMAVSALEAITVTLIPVAALINAVVGDSVESKPLAHASVLTVALVYGIGVLVGSLVLSMSLWDLVWKSPWMGPLSNLPSVVVSTVVFWSASLFLVDIGGIMLVITACLGFILVAREFMRLQG